MTPRGIRNNNPGNIKDFGIPWNGLATPSERTNENRNETTFCVFRRPWWGIRALARTLLTYQRKYGIGTISGIVARWAPSSDNNSEVDYVKFIADYTGKGKYEPLELTDYETMRSLCEAIITFENGENPYTWETTVALILAEIEPGV